MMTGPHEPWTTQDLELFHDEQLDSDRASKLTDDLRRDAVLRTRLAVVRRVDDALRTALLQPRAVRTVTYPARFGRLLAVACLLLVVGVSGWLVWSRTGGPADAPARLAQVPAQPSVRVIFSLPLPAGWKPAISEPHADRQRSSNDSETSFQSRVGEALLAGRVEDALHLLATVPPERRRAAYKYLGELLRSAQAAELILDRLSPGEQLSVCNQWAAEPTMRPIVFARLRRLSAEPSLASELNSVLAELSADPALRAWMRGYQLQQRG